MKYVHLKCLQQWLKSKLHIKQSGHATTIYWKALECELCKKAFANNFEIENQKFDLISIDKPDSAYIILEILSKEKNVSRGVHVIKMESKNNIRLGRGHDSDIRITDISVSRCHALIKMEKGSFYIEDNNSKFGTLVHMRKPFAMTGDYGNISVQVGRSVLALNIKKNWKLLPACFRSQTGDVNTSGEEISVSGEEILIESDNPRPNNPRNHGDSIHINEANAEPVSPINIDGDIGDDIDDDGLSNPSGDDHDDDEIPNGNNQNNNNNPPADVHG